MLYPKNRIKYGESIRSLCALNVTNVLFILSKSFNFLQLVYMYTWVFLLLKLINLF